MGKTKRMGILGFLPRFLFFESSLSSCSLWDSLLLNLSPRTVFLDGICLVHSTCINAGRGKEKKG